PPPAGARAGGAAGRALGAFRSPPPAPASPPPAPPAPSPSPAGRGSRVDEPPAATASPGVAAPTDGAPAAAIPTRDQLTKAWGDSILGHLSARLRARFSAGRFVAVEDGTAVFALPNRAHRDQCMPLRNEVEQVLSAYFGRRIPLKLVADLPTVGSPPPAPEDDEEVVSLSELRDAPAVPPTSPADRLKSAFPGAKEVEG
ncbi:MAG TPA: hypothetical protein VFO65_04940, partial [Acidimicrobiales bacterium]|nr:hypothetical protein [Acidimicrobiales bacterium]